MPSRKPTFSRWSERQDADPAYRAARKETRREVEAVDRFVNALDPFRVFTPKLTKTAVARRISESPRALALVVKQGARTPSLETIAAVAREIGLSLSLVERRGPHGRRAA